MNTDAQNEGQKKPIRLIKWAIFNGAFLWCAWIAVEGNVGAGRLLAFAMWILAILFSLSTLNPEACKLIRKKGRVVSAWMSYGCDLALIGLLVWHGWWWTGIAALIIMVSTIVIFTEPNAKDHGSPRTGSDPTNKR